MRLISSAIRPFVQQLSEASNTKHPSPALLPVVYKGNPPRLQNAFPSHDVIILFPGLYQAALDKYHRVDIVINNAGVSGKDMPWQVTMDINFVSVPKRDLLPKLILSLSTSQILVFAYNTLKRNYCASGFDVKLTLISSQLVRKWCPTRASRQLDCCPKACSS